MNRAGRWRVAVLVTLMFPALALAATVPWVNLRQQSSAGVAGLRGSAVGWVPNHTSADYSGSLVALSFKTLGATPCEFRWGNHSDHRINGPGDRASIRWQRTLKRQQCTNPQVSAGATERTVRVPSENHYIRGIRVCTNRASSTDARSIRGVRLMLLESRNGALRETSQPEETTWDGCDEWHQAVSCPDGSIATAVDIHRGATSSTNFRGLELYCSPLAVPGGPHDWITGRETPRDSATPRRRAPRRQ